GREAADPRIAAEHAELDDVLAQKLLDARRGTVVHIDVELGIGGLEDAECLRQEIGPGKAGAADREPAAADLEDLANVLPRRGETRDDALRMLFQPLAGFGELHAPAAAIEQPRA